MGESEGRASVTCAAAAMIAVLTAAAGEARGALRLYDSFDYPATPASPTTGDRGLDGTIGAPVTQGGYPNSPATGTTAWYPTGAGGNYAVGAGGGLSVAAGNLSYPGLAPSAGNSVAHTGGFGYSPRRGFRGAPDFDAAGNATGEVSSTSNGSIYYSFLLRLDAMPAFNAVPDGNGNAGVADGAMVTFLNLTQGFGGANPSANPASVWVRNNGAGGFNVGVSKGEFTVTGAEQYAPSSYAVGQTLLIVAEYDFVANVNPNMRESNDLVRLWINPASLGGAAPGADVINTIAQDIGIGPPPPPIQSVAFRRTHSNLPPITVDELRVGDTFADVTPVPEPGAAALVAGLMILGMTQTRAAGRSRREG